VGLISYSMTHHTRQSALGLPFIVHKNYDGLECDVSEYTMSEIIASVYEMMKSSGIREGILFLDEINCVSETLAPLMLQFLQYKVFGKHQVPSGWIVVTAGNPPEYNNSVREFDVVTWDRLKRIDIEPDYAAWREYALRTGVHPSVLSYLELNKHHLYQVEPTAQGKRFVTARGWVDLSNMLKLYEHNGIEADANLMVQYLQDDEVAHAFAASYRLYVKYGSDYRVEGILDGTVAPDIMERASNAGFDERLAQIVDAEWDSRRSNKRVRLLRQAQLSCPDANVADIVYDADRGLDRSEMIELSNCTWVTERRNVVLVGASGAGKTWVGCALAVAACNAFHTVRYARMPEMLDELAASRDEDWLRAKKRYRKCDLLFVDDWLLEPVGAKGARELLELVESRYRNGSMIICSQYGPSGWHGRISEGALADAVIDRLVYNSRMIHLKGKESMRKRMAELNI
jgi:DNA replication protein DnaC